MLERQGCYFINCRIVKFFMGQFSRVLNRELISTRLFLLIYFFIEPFFTELFY